MDFISLAFNNMVDFINSSKTLHLVMNNRFLLILLVVFLSKIKHSTYRSIWLAGLINVPGTILHETAHFLVGLIMFAKPTSFSLWPKRTAKGYVMGSVGFRNIKFYNALPSAMAPLLLLIVGYYLNRYFFEYVNLSIGKYLLYILLQTIIIENALPSSTDFSVGFRYITGVLLYGIVIILCLALLL